MDVICVTVPESYVTVDCGFLESSRKFYAIVDFDLGSSTTHIAYVQGVSETASWEKSIILETWSRCVELAQLSRVFRCLNHYNV